MSEAQKESNKNKSFMGVFKEKLAENCASYAIPFFLVVISIFIIAMFGLKITTTEINIGGIKVGFAQPTGTMKPTIPSIDNTKTPSSKNVTPEVVDECDSQIIINFSDYENEEPCKEFYTSDLEVINAKENYVKGVTPEGEINISGLSLADPFEVEIRADLERSKVYVTLVAQGGDDIIIQLGKNDLVEFGNIKKDYRETGWIAGDAINSYKLKSSSDGIDFSINNEYFGNISVPSYVLYTQLIIRNIDEKQKLFSILIDNPD